MMISAAIETATMGNATRYGFAVWMNKLELAKIAYFRYAISA